jgi:hypothetical protein
MSKPNAKGTPSANAIPAVSVTYAQDGTSTSANNLGMRPMQERAYQKRGEQYLLIKSPPASGKSRALMFIALDKLENQGLKQAIIVVPEKAIGSSFHNEPLSQFGFWADWQVEPQWNLCDAPGGDNGGKVDAVKKSSIVKPRCWSVPTPPFALPSISSASKYWTIASSP